MKSILEEFAYGNISPEARYFKRDSEYGRAMQKLTDNEEKLLSLLDKAGKETYEQFADVQGEVNLLSGKDKFIYGYRLGVLMTMEVFNGMDDLIVDE